MLKEKILLIVSIMIVLLITLMPVNGNMLGHIGDKIVHTMIFMFLGICIMNLFGEKPITAKLLIMAALMGLIIEVVQDYIPGRNTSIFDGISNTSGLVIGSFFIEVKKIFKKEKIYR